MVSLTNELLFSSPKRKVRVVVFTFTRI